MDEQYFQILKDSTKPIGSRYQAIFHLKNINTQQSVKFLKEAYQYTIGSVLLTHQILYALGQVNQKYFEIFKDFLFERVQDQKQNGIARHQAAQSLANFFHLIPNLDGFFSKYTNYGCPQLRDTCKISLQKSKHRQLIDHYAHKFHATKQPAAPFTNQQFAQFLKQKKLQGFFMNMSFLGLLLKSQNQISLFQKYRIMYYMRDLGTKKEIRTLCELLTKKYFRYQSNLLKHEVCFILGQIGCDQYEDFIRQCIQNNQQGDIVRHQALAAVAGQSKDIDYLKKFTTHENQLIRQSAQVARFTIKYWRQ